MRIAVLGDIHGNAPALRAAYAAALAEGAGRVYHLGDLGGYAPFVNEAVEFVLDHAIAGVQGNYDAAVGSDAEHCGCRYESPEQAARSARSFEWTKAHATDASKRYMAGLPGTLTFEAGGLRVQLFHATPHKNNIYWTDERPDKFFMEMAAKAGDADVLVYGHTHKPYRRDAGGRVFINAGSTGKPKDGDPRACVALLTLGHGRVEHRFLRVEYDVEAVAEAIRGSGLPPEFADQLLTGR
jgi:putative phosphoesterase